MRKLMICLAGVAALALAACNPASVISGIGGAVTGANATLAQLAKNDVPAACGIVAVAEGYFEQLKPLISATNVARARNASQAVAAICDNPPANVGSAIATLAKLWLTIQNATKTTQ